MGDRGAITAELAMALPSVALVIAVTLGGFGLQIERMKLVSIAASASRALGRGEAEVSVREMVRETEERATLNVETLNNHICARLSRTFKIAGFQDFEVSERQCARKSGL